MRIWWHRRLERSGAPKAGWVDCWRQRVNSVQKISPDFFVGRIISCRHELPYKGLPAKLTLEWMDKYLHNYTFADLKKITVSTSRGDWKGHLGDFLQHLQNSQAEPKSQRAPHLCSLGYSLIKTLRCLWLLFHVTLYYDCDCFSQLSEMYFHKVWGPVEGGQVRSYYSNVKMIRCTTR